MYVELCLVADKPFIRHVCGLLSHNADGFGSPFCGCCDIDLFNFSMSKLDHYGKITFKILCNRAHVPLWQALDQPEPEHWCFTCDCCNEVSPAAVPFCSYYFTLSAIHMTCAQVYDKAEGGVAKLEREAVSRSSASASDQERYARLHLSSQFDMEPLIPFHYVQWDPMHGLHNELNVLLDEVCVFL